MYGPHPGMVGAPPLSAGVAAPARAATPVALTEKGCLGELLEILLGVLLEERQCPKYLTSCP